MEALKLKYTDTNYLEFSKRNCAILWTNGTGKSTLSKKIYMLNSPNKIQIIRAQRELAINQGALKWTMDEVLEKSLSSYSTPKLGDNLNTDHLWNDQVSNYHNNIIQTDFNRNIEYLFREDNNAHSDASRNYEEWVFIKPSTRAEKVFNIWNEVFLNKKISIREWKIQVLFSKKSGELSNYEIENLSDWERSALYLITKCIYAPENWLIIVDEGETHLNPALLHDLWDKIEESRKDCRFIYISHSIEFIISRTDCTKFWIKEFTHPEEWQIDEINKEELPEELILQIIWTKKHKILFVESNEDKDKLLYQRIYPDFKVIPVSSCENVINFTKSLRKTLNNYNKEYFWLIDRDFNNDARIKSLESEKVFSLPVAEFENIFFREEVIKFTLKHLWRQSEFDEKILQIKESVFSLKNDDSFKKNFFKNYTIWSFNRSLSKFELSKSFKFEDDYSEVNKLWKLIESENNYNKFLEVLNTKSITGESAKLWLNWIPYKTQVINIFNTPEGEKLKIVFLDFMPDIK